MSVAALEARCRLSGQPLTGYRLDAGDRDDEIVFIGSLGVGLTSERRVGALYADPARTC